jgi:hypothetical protein
MSHSRQVVTIITRDDELQHHIPTSSSQQSSSSLIYSTIAMKEESVPTSLDYQQGYEHLLELYINNPIEECIRASEHYLLDLRTPWYYRAMTHLILAVSTGDWDHTESHRASAENIYRVTRNQHYPTSDDSSTEANLMHLRDALDHLRDLQASLEPSFESGSEVEEEIPDDGAELVTEEEEQEEVQLAPDIE